MPVEIREQADGNVLEVVISGKLSKSDYQHFVPAVEGMISRGGKVRMLVEMRDFHGWDTGALWEDIKFDLKHFSDIERLALIGETKWEKGMAVFCKPFTTAKVKYFEQGHEADARAWLLE